MRPVVIPSVVLAAALALAAIPAVGQPVDPLRVTILDVGMFSQSLRITMATIRCDRQVAFGCKAAYAVSCRHEPAGGHIRSRMGAPAPGL